MSVRFSQATIAAPEVIVQVGTPTTGVVGSSSNMDIKTVSFVTPAFSTETFVLTNLLINRFANLSCVLTSYVNGAPGINGSPRVYFGPVGNGSIPIVIHNAGTTALNGVMHVSVVIF